MRHVAFALAMMLAACSAPATDRPVGRPVEPPVVVVDPPREVTTTAPPSETPFPVDILTDPAPATAGMDALGTFTLRYDPDLNCLYHLEEDNNGEPGTGGRVVIQWPFGYTAMHQAGKVIVFDKDSKAMAVTGIEFQMGGGGGSFDGTGIPGGCDAVGIWYANGDPLSSG